MTFLLSDIVGSSRLWEQDSHAMDAAVRIHDAIIESSIAAHHGSLVRPRGEGDSRFAVFTSAAEAIVAACQIQIELRQQTWPTSVPLRVRIAVNTGEALLRAGDYYGSPVNRCARLRDLCHGEQVLTGENSYVLARDHLPAPIRLQSLGMHRLRELERQEHVYQAKHRDLPVSFPPLKGVDQRLHNLPAQPDRMFGRILDVQRICARLRDGVRLMTLTGPAGVGKTRLALRVADELVHEFAEGVWFVQLADVTDPDRVASAVAEVLGVLERADVQLDDRLEEFLRSRSVLLVVDGPEQVLPTSANFVSRLLKNCANVSILATSQIRLNVAFEHTYAVEPLPLPDAASQASADNVMRSPAVALFVERASAAMNTFALHDSDAATVAEICKRVDGLPLAIELAASQVRHFGAAELLRRLHPSQLGGGPSDAPPHHQTLHRAIELSVNLLEPAQLAVFRRMAVFAGGAAPEDAEQVCASDPVDSVDVTQELGALIDHSLLACPHPTRDGRFEKLQTIRQYGLEVLRDSGEEQKIFQRYADTYLRKAERESQPWLTGPTQLEWLYGLEQELDNLRAILTWSLEAGDLEIGLRIVGITWPLWKLRASIGDIRAWLATALERTAEPSSTVSRMVRANATLAAGELACTVGDTDATMSLAEEALRLDREIGDPSIRARALHLRGWATAAGAQHDEDYERAADDQAECRELCRVLRDGWGEARAVHELGEIARYRAQTRDNIREFQTLCEEARRSLGQALRLRSALGDDDREGLAWSRHCHGLLEYDIGQRADPDVRREAGQLDEVARRHYELARTWATQALSTWHGLPVRGELGEAATCGLIARIEWKLGRPAEAARAAWVSLELWPKLGLRDWLVLDILVLSVLSLELSPDTTGAETAARLFCQAVGGREAPLYRRQEVEQIRAAIVARLGAGAFQAIEDRTAKQPAQMALADALAIAKRHAGSLQVPAWSIEQPLV